MKRRTFIAGNWKMNLGPQAAAQLSSELRSLAASYRGLDLAVFPSTLALNAAVKALTGTHIEVGIQSIHWEPSGAFTGANSAELARELSCTYALIGHSEQRTLFGVTNEQTRKKVKAALRAGLLPLLCVGETLQQRQAQQQESVVRQQLSEALEGLESDEVATVTLAYEPVWAIGTGQVATPEQAQKMHAFIRSCLFGSHPKYVGEQMRIQYGGSVNGSNARAILECPDIDGALVGGASLNAQSFVEILRAAPGARDLQQ